MKVSMPSRAYTSFLLPYQCFYIQFQSECQCPLGLIPHFYGVEKVKRIYIMIVSMPSRAYTSFLHDRCVDVYVNFGYVSMPSRAYTSFLRDGSSRIRLWNFKVSMPSRAYTSFLRIPESTVCFNNRWCQCPLGLIPHFYISCSVYIRPQGGKVSMPSRAYTSFLPRKDTERKLVLRCVNALSGLYLISTKMPGERMY